MNAESVASYVVMLVLGAAVGAASKRPLGRVSLCLLVALFGAGLLGYFLGMEAAARASLPLWVGLAGLLLIPAGLLMALFALPQAGFDRVFPRRHHQGD